jgi:hypothetical protein
MQGLPKLARSCDSQACVHQVVFLEDQPTLFKKLANKGFQNPYGESLVLPTIKTYCYFIRIITAD